MLIAIRFTPAELYAVVHEIIRMAYPGARLSADPVQWALAGLSLVLGLEKANGRWIISGQIDRQGQMTNRMTVLPVDENNTEDSIVKSAQGPIKKFCLELLQEHLNKRISSYGTLTGVRPVKMVHNWLDQGLDHRQIVDDLQRKFLVDRDKGELLTEVAANNRCCWLTVPEEEKDRYVSIYIGIPYCLTRCHYCSFSGVILQNYSDIRFFMDCLIQEMNAIGNYISDNGLKVHTIYIGGGTPTILDIRDLQRIFAVLVDRFALCQAAEVTVEAGRPDTISLDKLRFFKDMRVTRICINPQTMKDSTLTLIGRQHTAREAINAVELVRQAGIKHLNMDLIIGLPLETARDHMESLEQIVSLQPDNITIHTLAMKRGSLDVRDQEQHPTQLGPAEIEKSLANIYQHIRQEGYHPYYLYRQKNMRANAENIGYSRIGSFCLYNILMVEEKQTIIGLGGGASSKFVDHRQGTVTSFYNPKNPVPYCVDLARLINCKVDKLRTLN